MSDPTLIGLTVLLLFRQRVLRRCGVRADLGSATAIEPRAVEGVARRAHHDPCDGAACRELACAQLGITVCSLGLGSLGEPAVAHVLEGVFESVGIPESHLHPISSRFALAIIVSLHVVIGEMVPKNMALAAPDRYAQLLTPALVLGRPCGPPDHRAHERCRERHPGAG